jgi:hypothetical protein
MPPPPAEALRELAEKYRRLATLRVQRDAGAVRATRATLRALATRFPGALRELDTLGLPELQRRAAAAARAAGGGPGEPWMAWIAAYHDLMSFAFELKRSERPPARAPVVPVDDETLRALRKPPGGRLSPVVLRLVARHFGVPAATVAATLFPTRRPSPYKL